MAELVNAVSKYRSLVAFALTSTVSLDECLDGLQTMKGEIRDLKEEVKALRAALQFLHQRTLSDVDVSGLDMSGLDIPAIDFTKLPLLQCGTTCIAFKTAIPGYSAALEDWAEFNGIRRDISGFKNMLGRYRSTIVITISYTTW
jgi:hypothetical protein